MLQTTGIINTMRINHEDEDIIDEQITDAIFIPLGDRKKQ
jgi:hypothetical protein